jgi:hypothetical protein
VPRRHRGWVVAGPVRVSFGGAGQMCGAVREGRRRCWLAAWMPSAMVAHQAAGCHPALVARASMTPPRNPAVPARSWGRLTRPPITSGWEMRGPGDNTPHALEGPTPSEASGASRPDELEVWRPAAGRRPLPKAPRPGGLAAGRPSKRSTLSLPVTPMLCSAFSPTRLPLTSQAPQRRPSAEDHTYTVLCDARGAQRCGMVTVVRGPEGKGGARCSALGRAGSQGVGEGPGERGSDKPCSAGFAMRRPLQGT